MNTKDDRIKIEPIQKDDLIGYYSLFSDKDIHPYIIENGPLSLEQTKEKLSNMVKAENHIYLSIKTLIDNKFIGYIGIHNIKASLPAISYGILKQFQRKKFCTEAINLLIDYQLEHKEFDGFIARTHTPNIKSQNFLEYMNFESMGEVDWDGEKRLEFRMIFSS